MESPMRPSGSQEAPRSRVAADPHPPCQQQQANFEYDDNEWDIGIGDLIIDLDADIEKTDEGGQAMATTAAGAQAGKPSSAQAKMAIEHSATVDKGLKMKIKRTKPGTKTSEAKHEIVKSNEQNGAVEGANPGDKPKHPGTPQTPSNTSKRASSGHRRDKTREKHSSSEKTPTTPSNTKAPPQGVAVPVSDVNGLVRLGNPPPTPQRPVFPPSTGPGPPIHSGPPNSVNNLPQMPPTLKQDSKTSVSAVPTNVPSANCASSSSNAQEDISASSSSPPPAKKLKTEPKDVSDVCIGTSVGTITEPDCLGPCEPGTSVTLEGIVWHETEGGVLVVNVTWRGKTYVGTLLDCTRHDWAPPRFCDSPTSDLDTRTPKGRETRSSAHSKLRNGGGGAKGRRGAANGSGPSTAPSSPTPFIPPRPEPSNKRKSRAGEEDPQAPIPTNKKTKVAPPQVPPAPCGSPPPSPVLLECPEPNCSKKYKHINGLKYHQSHAHGSADDEESKDITSMSENDESNIEAPSPATPVKSPEKSQDSPMTPVKKEATTELPLILRGNALLDVPSQPATPRSTPPSPVIPQSVQEISTNAGSPTVPTAEAKSVVKPGVLRYNPTEEFQVGVFNTSNKPTVPGTPLTNSTQVGATRPPVGVSVSPEVTNTQPEVLATPQQGAQPIQPQPVSFANQITPQVSLPSQPFSQPPTLLIPAQNAPGAPTLGSQPSPHPPQSPKSGGNINQFKVKPAAALMPDDKKDRSTKSTPNFKKKSRKSPAGSPDPPENQPPAFGMEPSGRDEVQSPAYSDISDDGAPVIDTDVDKNKSDKKNETGQPMPHMPQYGMYPFYSQPQYMVQSSAVPPTAEKSKESEKVIEKPVEKDVKKEPSDYQQKVMPQHYYPYGYMGPGYPYEPNFGSLPIVPEDKIKEERVKDEPTTDLVAKPVVAPIPNPIQVPNPQKVKTEPPNIKEKHQNENHQILKESIEMKNQMSPYNMYARPNQPPHHGQREEELRRYYVYEQRRKEQSQGAPEHKNSNSSSAPSKIPPVQSPQLKHSKDKGDEKKDKDGKQEGVKPTMETQGPPPPPTSQYAYIHPTYVQSPHYGPLAAFDPSHPMYRGLMVPGPYSGNPYLHPQIPRYHAPEDLSRAPPPTKALEMLQHHAQYFSSHKIHELQERAIKSPTPTKTSVASSSPSTNSAPSGPPQSAPSGAPPTSQSSGTVSSGGKQTPGENKESRSPPPQRHVHTHHHTHVGLGYPMYPAPYGAAVLASQQAAAVTVINPYPPK